MAKNLEHLKEKAREFYISGMSLPDIGLHLNKSKGTVHYWLRGLERHSRSTPEMTASALAASKSNTKRAQDRKETYKQEALLQTYRLQQEPGFRDFIMLYLTEGTRKCKAGCMVAVANSNPHLVKLATRYIRELTQKEPEFCVQYHVDQDPVQLAAFWSSQVGTTPDLIKFQRKSNSGRLGGRSWASKYGVLTVRTGSVRVRTMIGVWMDALQEMW